MLQISWKNYIEFNLYTPDTLFDYNGLNETRQCSETENVHPPISIACLPNSTLIFVICDFVHSVDTVLSSYNISKGTGLSTDSIDFSSVCLNYSSHYVCTYQRFLAFWNAYKSSFIKQVHCGIV